MSFRVSMGPWILGLVLALLGHGAGAGQPATGDVSGGEAFGALAKEQSLAEGYVGLLETVGKGDLAAYAEGIRLYAQAKADFDGLIEQMKYDITARVPFDGSAPFKAVLGKAVNRRIAFTTHVDKIVEALPNKTPRGVTDYLLGGASELVSALTEAGKAIWEAYWSVEQADRQDRETRRQEMLAQLDALKWKPFHELVRPPA